MLSESEIILFSKTYNHPIWNCLPMGSIWNSPEHAPREEGALQLWHTPRVIKHVFTAWSAPLPLFLSFVCMGAGLCGRQVFLCFIVSVPCIEFRLSGLGAVPVEPSLWPPCSFQSLSFETLPYRLPSDILTRFLSLFSQLMITLDCSQPCRISPSGKGSD